MTCWLIAAAALLAAACGSRTVALSSATLPDPSGCFVLVFENPDFVGRRDFINGPAAYPTLERLPNGSNWQHRIRSVRMGPAADMTAWTEAEFQGESITFGYDKSYPRLTPAFNGRIAAAEITCVREPANPLAAATVESSKQRVLH